MERSKKNMNFDDAFPAANPNISMSADDFIRMKNLQEGLKQQNEQLLRRCGAVQEQSQQLSRRCGALQEQNQQLSRRCGALEDQLRMQMQARQERESQLFQVQQGRQARENEIMALREQLHQERLRADAMCRAGGPVPNPASIPLRIVPVGDSRTDEAEAREFGRNDSVNPSNPSSYPSEPSPGPEPPMSQYPCEIPEKDRKAIRARMLKDRGPNTPLAPDPPTVDTQAPAASPHDVEMAPRAPSPGVHVYGSFHDDVVAQNEASASHLGQDGDAGAADVHGEATGREMPQDGASTSQLGQGGETRAPDVDGEETEDDTSQNEAGTPQLGPEEETGAPDVDSEETEDDCAANDMEVDDDDDDDDFGAHDTTTSASSFTLGCPGKQEPCDGVDAPSPTGTEQVVTSPTVVGDAVTNNGYAPVKSESSEVPCATFGTSAPAASTAAGEPVATSSATNGEEAEKPVGIPSSAGAVFTEPPVVKAEAFTSYTSAAVSCDAQMATTCSTSPAPISFTHQLFSPSLTTANSTRSVDNAMDTIAHPDSVDDRETHAVDRRWEGDDIEFKQATDLRMDRRSHNTFCSSCKSFRTDQEALAKCAACPRMLCRTCAGRKGEKVPRGVNADDIVLSPDKCLCQKRDSEFPKPPGNVDPHAHLLKQLKKHDLAHMFLEPVNVEENTDYLSYISRDDMIDLGTMTTNMTKRKQYQSSRGKVMFRRDLMRMWENCWTFAGHTPECPAEKTAGIVRCTLILEAMVRKFYNAYMEEIQLVTDEESWLAERERRHHEKFDMCARPGGGMQDELEPPVAAAKYEDDSEDNMDLDEENRRIGATVVRKRKFVFRDDDDCDDDKPVSKASALKEGLDGNICALAAIGQQLKHSSSKT